MFSHIVKRILLCFSLCFYFSANAEAVFANSPFSFSGELDFLNKKVNVLSEESQENFFEMKMDDYSDEGFTLHLKFNHFKTSFFDLSSDIKAKVQMSSPEGTTDKVIAGELTSEYSLFDYKPIEELSGKFELKNHQIDIQSVSYGKITCNGTISTKPPYEMDLTFTLKEVEMASFLRFWTHEPEQDASGLVSGEIKVSGPWQTIFLQGKLVSYDGHVDQLEFNKFYLNIEGNYPDMKISDSLVSQPEGMSFVFNGNINLEEFGDFEKQVKALSISPDVRESGSQVEWTFKSTNQKDMGKMELKYLLREDDDFGSLEGKGSDMLGIENTFEF